MKLSTALLFKKMQDNNHFVQLSDEELSALQDILTEMLFDVSDWCEANGVEYILTSGTCLGAIRHQGFIPWDDDVDLNMPRESFELFKKEFPLYRPDKYVVQSPGDDDYALGIGRVRRRNTLVLDTNDITRDNAGAFLDIFIIDNAPSHAVVRALHGLVSLGLGFALSCRRFAVFSDEYISIVDGDSQLESSVKAKAAIGRVLSFAPVKTWASVWDKWNGLFRNNKSDIVTIPGSVHHYFKTLLPRLSFFPTKKAVFEGRTLPIPNKPEVVLPIDYGEGFMTIPKVENRETHSFFEFDLGELGPR